MILTSAVYLKACWQEQFPSIETEPFFIDKDTTINVPMIKHSHYYMYKDLKRWKAEGIQIPYRVSYIKLFLNCNVFDIQ